MTEKKSTKRVKVGEMRDPFTRAEGRRYANEEVEP
jgi:hypothetical protein